MGKRGPKPGTMPKGKAAEAMFKPGQSGNPSGLSSTVQRLRVSLEEEMLAFLDEDVEVQDKATGQKKVIKRLRLMVNQLYKEGVEGTGSSMVRAQAEIFDRAFGKAKQPIEHSGVMPVTIVDDVPTIVDAEPAEK